MFLLVGNSVRLIQLVIVAFTCRFCGLNVPQHVLKRVNRLTVFFIPLIPLSTKYYVECSNCGGTIALTSDQAHNATEWAARQSVR
jgi:uncharacterized Zn finger protein